MSDVQEFDQAKFGRQLSRYAEWVSAAFQGRDGGECRLRAEAAVRWLEEQRQLAPPSLHSLIDQMIRDVNGMTAGMEKPDRPYPALDISEFAAYRRDDEIARQHAEEHLARFEGVLSQFESPLRESLAYCLAATKGQASPDSAHDWNHLLISILTKLCDATLTKNNAVINESLKLLRKWTANATLAPGYERSVFERHAKIITDTLVIDRPLGSNKFLGHTAEDPSTPSANVKNPLSNLIGNIFKRRRNSPDKHS